MSFQLSPSSLPLMLRTWVCAWQCKLQDGGISRMVRLVSAWHGEQGTPLTMWDRQNEQEINLRCVALWRFIFACRQPGPT